jgi:uncharacterized membrane protein
MVETDRVQSSRLVWASVLLGFALGGFFDGILLHQILQWHHLLSLVDSLDDLGAQVLFDGLFHALMYVIGAAGIIMLVRARGAMKAENAARSIIACALIGFGSWHMLDGLLSHWLLGIHRIKLDSPHPLLWDLGWFVGFGALPAIAGWMLRRQGGNVGPGPAIAGLLLAATLGGGIWAAQAPADSDTAIAVFRPGLTEADAMRAIVASGGSLLWEKNGIWAVRWGADARSAMLYDHGALLVSNSFLAAGCLAWTRI